MRLPVRYAAAGADASVLSGSRLWKLLLALERIQDATLGEAPELRSIVGRLVACDNDGSTAGPRAAQSGSRVGLELGPVRGTV